MKRVLLVLSLSIFSASAFAESVKFHRCESKLFSQLQLLSKVSVELPKSDPTGDLARLVLKYEMLCPWQVEKDFNNDRKKDWVGFVYRDQKYQLIAYLSGNQRYRLQELESYAKFPKYSFIKIMKAKEVYQRTQKPDLAKAAKYSVVVHDLRYKSSVYIWDGKKLARSFDFQKEFDLDTQKEAENKRLQEEEENID